MYLALAQRPTPPYTAVRDLLAADALAIHFQPIASLTEGRLHGHEALVRPPPDCPWPSPDRLFAAAREEGVALDLELACLRLALRGWSQQPRAGKLFVNMSAAALLQGLDTQGLDRTFAQAGTADMLPQLVIELTEHDHVAHVQALQEALAPLRRAGVGLALDDFGDGHSSLRVWSELRPEYVKIDKYFTQGVNHHSHKLQTYRALLQIAETLGSQLVAEGVETEDELRVIRDIGIDYAQGFFLGRPAPQALVGLSDPTHKVICSREIAVLPHQRHASNRALTAETLLIAAPALDARATHDEAVAVFRQHPELHALALVEQGRPVGLVPRQSIQDLYLQPYFRELMGRRPCALHANPKPVLVELQTHIEHLTEILTSSDQRYLTEGFVMVEGGQYRGLGTGEHLVRAVTEARIEAARHANPLTFLPGNIPITIHIERLPDSGQPFVACYADLNHFKSFNDHYGYWRGDEMIRLEAEAIVQAFDPRRDFVGHVGGDDFVMLLQSPDWTTRCLQAVQHFNTKALDLFDPQARLAGGIHAEDRQGVMRFHACTTLSIGVIQVRAGQFSRAEEVASAAAMAKHRAKQAQQGVYLMDVQELGRTTG